MLKIEKNIPIVPRTYESLGIPWEDMQVGDSVFMEVPEPNWERGKWATVRNRASIVGKRLNRRFSVRREGTGIRIWRTE